MLQLPGRIGLRVDIADLLHLKTAFQAHRIVDSTADKEHILCVHLLRREPLDPLLILEKLLDLIRDRLKLRDQLRRPVLIDHSTDAGKFDG